MAKQFEPPFMQVGVLTAALQELTPRQVRDEKPDQAIYDWLRYASRLGVDGIQLSAALHPSVANVPEEALLDPTANHLDLREPFTKERAEMVLAVAQTHKVQILDLAYFDNMLHWDQAIRRQKHDFMLRVFDAAVLLGVKSVCGFVGKNEDLSMDQNLDDFRASFVPLLKEAQARGLRVLIENCPMPGWTTGDSCINNIANCAGMWMKLAEICEEEGVEDAFGIHYDPSHDILQGINPAATFDLLRECGYGELIGGFHVKGQVINPRGLAQWGYHGQTVDRGDWEGGKPSSDPGKQANAWRKQTSLCEHELPGTARYDPMAILMNQTVDWFGLFLAAYESLDFDPATTPLIVEHEFHQARIQDAERLRPILQGSIAYVRKIYEAAACMYTLQNEVMEDQGIEVQESAWAEESE